MIIGVELFLALLKRNVFLLLIIHAVQAVKLYTVIMMEIGGNESYNIKILKKKKKKKNSFINKILTSNNLIKNYIYIYIHIIVIIIIYHNIYN